MTIEELDAILNIQEVEETLANDDMCLKKMTQCLVNEMNCPDLLDYQTELITNLRELMECQLSNLNADFVLNLVVLQEIERIKFILRLYFKTRIDKIQRYTIELLATSLGKMYH
jgi:GINS complex protein